MKHIAHSGTFRFLCVMCKEIIAVIYPVKTKERAAEKNAAPIFFHRSCGTSITYILLICSLLEVAFNIV